MNEPAPTTVDHTTTTPGVEEPPAPTGCTATTEASDDLLVDDLLVEEISIDGMCGVY